MKLCHIMRAHSEILLYFHNTFTTKHKLMVFENKEIVKKHKLPGYYSYKS